MVGVVVLLLLASLAEGGGRLEDPERMLSEGQRAAISELLESAALPGDGRCNLDVR